MEKFYKIIIFIMFLLNYNTRIFAKYELTTISGIYLFSKYFNQTQDKNSLRWLYGQMAQNQSAFLRNRHFIKNKQFFVHLLSDHLTLLKERRLKTTKIICKSKLAKACVFFQMSQWISSLNLLNLDPSDKKIEINKMILLKYGLTCMYQLVPYLYVLYQGATSLLAGFRYRSTIPQKIQRDKELLKIIRDNQVVTTICD
ncbi:hypothetical protein KG892_00240 [Vermiphilus pyriformis]|jgi:hypothetical protein|uniref:Uncharacterized protein n=1 Tax=candidate division TM6 bacterium JCVI TM6SC1 TaxID=1306947 RepID=A0A0D2I1L3_9BACT|nr:hypothetical protein J120_04270 [candidate division TM6 bacterium JCVI TM6SC1]UNE35449.1 MAG: hypothetical protein KG892_00240 [Vermiphilus pyriformis]